MDINSYMILNGGKEVYSIIHCLESDALLELARVRSLYSNQGLFSCFSMFRLTEIK